eukprot:TRINITY_DN51_c4_g1_i1.p1 TRINITY_DN51_c4_g1~~TRINITY_DN51_c4_g1_i1.p1  ORF type:complete len:188 (-),score=102.96 TRINITY_DN51_c4_g1_i1:185-748(-)
MDSRSALRAALNSNCNKNCDILHPRSINLCVNKKTFCATVISPNKEQLWQATQELQEIVGQGLSNFLHGTRKPLTFGPYEAPERFSVPFILPPRASSTLPTTNNNHFYFDDYQFQQQQTQTQTQIQFVTPIRPTSPSPNKNSHEFDFEFEETFSNNNNNNEVSILTSPKTHCSNENESIQTLILSKA